MPRPSILLASNNPHKLEEIRRILDAAGVDTRTPAELVSPPRSGSFVPSPNVHDPIPDPEESADTYLGNAVIKARAFSEWSGLPALADDSGLEVAVLGGAPGVHSSRYSGEGATAARNRLRLLRELAGRPREERRARFVTVIVLCRGPELLYRATGECRGEIASEPRGSGGFGYDPLFVPEGEVRTFAEMPAAEKDRISHRGRALARLRRDVAGGIFPTGLAGSPPPR